ncbi:MAG: hypothetical protein AAF480_08490 [Actinomycetota bacterium]
MTTEIGAIGHEPLFRVDGAGVVRDLDGLVGLDWWVGAEDRWHRASIEHAVRQGLGEDEVTVETRLRVPGGDIVSRATGAASSGRGVCLLEFENETPVPVAVALVVKLPGPGSIEVDDDTLTVDGVPMLRAGRSVARCLIATNGDALAAGFEAGDALPPAELDLPVEGRVVGLIFPVPHTAILKSVLTTDGGAMLGGPADLPPIDAVARGWHLHVERGARMEVPDERVLRVLAAARRHVLLGSAAAPDSGFWRDDPGWLTAAAAVGLDAWGHHTEARELLLAATGVDDLTTHAARTGTEAGALVWAWAELLERRPDPDLLEALTGWLTEAAIGLTRRRRGLFGRRDRGADSGWRAVGLASAASLLSRIEDGTIGPDLVDALPDLVDELRPEPSSLALALGGRRLGGDVDTTVLDLLAERLEVEATLPAVAAASSPTGALAGPHRAHDPLASILYLIAARRAIVDEPDGTGGPIAIVPGVPEEWFGAAIEAHAVPVTGGAVAFGVRWHGERPAVLWDVATAAPTTISAPSLDPSWSDDRPRAEALLEVTPGLRVEEAPRGPEPAQGRSIEIEDDPDSFG